MDYPIPKRVTSIPEWIGSKDVDVTVVANDIVSISYWRTVDEHARQLALKRMEDQGLTSDELDREEIYNEFLDYATDEIVTALNNDIYARARMLAEGTDNGFDSMVTLNDAVEQVQALIALNIKEMGLLPYLEHSDMNEYLLSKRQKIEESGKRPGIWYDLTFMIDYLIPVLEANGFSREVIFGIEKNYHKARFAASYIRDLLSETIDRARTIRAQMSEIEDEDERARLEKSLHDAMQLDTRLKDSLESLAKEMSVSAAEGGMSALEFRDEIRKIARGDTEVKKVDGYAYNLKTGSILVISIDSTRMSNAIQNLTAKLVDWHLGEPEDIAREVGKYLLTKDI